MSRRVCPVVQRHGANVDAYAVSSAHVPVDSNVGSMYAQLLRRFYWSPDFVSVVFACNLSVLLKIRVYRQKLFTVSNAGKTGNIRFSTWVGKVVMQLHLIEKSLCALWNRLRI
jgi:hypothetical protein